MDSDIILFLIFCYLVLSISKLNNTKQMYNREPPINKAPTYRKANKL